jgi:MFS family permease
MSATLRVILASVSGLIIGGLFYSLATGFIIFILDKVDKSGGWIGVFQNPSLLASIFGAVFGSVIGFFIGLLIGIFRITALLKGALMGFIVTELMVLIVLVAFSLMDFSHSSNFDRLSESAISGFFLFLILSLCFLIPSVIIGATTVKLNNFTHSTLNLQNQER